MLGRQCYELSAPVEENRIGTDEQEPDSLLEQGREHGVDLLIRTSLEDVELQPERSCQSCASFRQQIGHSDCWD